MSDTHLSSTPLGGDGVDGPQPPRGLLGTGGKVVPVERKKYGRLSTWRRRRFSGVLTGTHVALVGDETLDNSNWVKARRETKADLHAQLLQALSSEGDDLDNAPRVTRLAVDESRVSSALYGQKPGLRSREDKRISKMPAYPLSDDGRVYQIQKLKEICSGMGGVSHLVLAVGWNDIRATLSQKYDPDRIQKALLATKFEADFYMLLELALEMVPSCILVFMFQPYFTSLPHMWTLPNPNTLMELIVRAMPMYIKAAKKFKIPLIDLARTLDPYSKANYGASPMSLGEKGGEELVEIIKKIMVDFKFGEEAPKVYCWKRDQIESEELGSNFDEGGQYYRWLLKDYNGECANNFYSSNLCSRCSVM